MTRSLTLLVHGGPKVGKTTFGSTAPYPRLFLDAEGGTRFLKQAKRVWDPMSEEPPIADGTWETCIVYVRDYQTVLRVYQWLSTGQHQFRSVVMDSISEIQQRCVDALVGANPMKRDNWGDLLRQMSVVVRQFRDLTFHPTNPLEAVVIIAMGRTVEGVHRPHVQGQLGVTLPYYLDTYGYIFVQQLEDGTALRRLLVAPDPLFECGDRTGMLPPIVDNPDIEEMLTMIYGPRAA